jgi:hypothetical protein
MVMSDPLLEAELEKNLENFFLQSPNIPRNKITEFTYKQAFKKAYAVKVLPEPQEVFESDYSPGLLPTYGGGNITWWHGYIRAEIENANDYWRSILENTTRKD